MIFFPSVNYLTPPLPITKLFCRAWADGPSRWAKRAPLPKYPAARRIEMSSRRFIGDRDTPMSFASMRRRRAVLGTGHRPEALREMARSRSFYIESSSDPSSLSDWSLADRGMERRFAFWPPG